MSRPEDLKYTKTHEWVRVRGETGEVGITDYAVEQLGDLAFIDLPETGRECAAGDSLGEIESTKTVSELYAPVGGEVVEVHDDLQDDLQQVTDSPFEAGWLVRIRLADPGQLDGLLDAAAYAAHVEAEEAH